jgi:hypothetical protein
LELFRLDWVLDELLRGYKKPPHLRTAALASSAGGGAMNPASSTSRSAFARIARHAAYRPNARRRPWSLWRAWRGRGPPGHSC